MTDAQTLEYMSPGLLKVVERAKREPEGRFNSLAHLIDVPALERAYHRQRPDAAVGVDGVTKEAYGQNLEANLQDRHTRLKTKRYRHQPIRRVHIPEAQGRIGQTKGIFPPPARPSASAGGRCSRAAMAAAPASSGCLPQQLAARRSAAMRDLDMPLRMGKVAS